MRFKFQIISVLLLHHTNPRKKVCHNHRPWVHDHISPKRNEVIYARTSNHEFVYRTKKDSTELFIDNQKVGVINNKGLLHGGRRNRLLARINKNENELELPIIIGDKERGTLMKPESGSVNPRAFQFVGEMGKNEEAVFLSLAVLELVKDSIKK